MPSLEELRQVLDATLDAHLFRGMDDPNGMWRAGTGAISGVRLLLEPWDGIGEWVSEEQLDALFVHRPWHLPNHLPGNLAVLAYHLSFDERLTIGFNPLLAIALEMSDLEALGSKEGRPIGMIGNVRPTEVFRFATVLAQSFAGAPSIVGRDACGVRRVAIVGAMWPELIVEAAQRGADIYVTGTIRSRALPAVEKTGLPVIVVGHHPPEIWGLRMLARVIGDTFPDIKVAVAPTAALSADPPVKTVPFR